MLGKKIKEHARQTLWPAKPKIFTSWPSPEKVCRQRTMLGAVRAEDQPSCGEWILGPELELSEGAHPPRLTERIEAWNQGGHLTHSQRQLGEETANSQESRIKRQRRLWDLEPEGPFGYEAKTFLFAQASLSWEAVMMSADWQVCPGAAGHAGFCGWNALYLLCLLRSACPTMISPPPLLCPLPPHLVPE